MLVIKENLKTNEINKFRARTGVITKRNNFVIIDRDEKTVLVKEPFKEISFDNKMAYIITENFKYSIPKSTFKDTRYDNKNEA